MQSSEYKVGSISIAPALVLAPMSGVTNVAFRRLIRELNPGALGLSVSEFISVEALTRQSRRSLEMMRFYETERPIAIQIFGWDIQRMRDAALMVQDTGVDIVDINCGCPAPKVVKRGGGCDLMRQPDHFAKILREVRKTVSIPLTVKFRSGWDSENINALEFARIAESEGADALAVHGRTRAQLYRGEADWEIVRQVSQAVKIPVLGSGDVRDAESARARLLNGVAGLMIGRAAISNPLVFGEIVNGQPSHLKRDPLRLISIIMRYIELLREDFEPRHCVGRVKQLVSQMARGHTWSRDLCRLNTLPEQLTLLMETRAKIECDSNAGGIDRREGFVTEPVEASSDRQYA